MDTKKIPPIEDPVEGSPDTYEETDWDYYEALYGPSNKKDVKDNVLSEDEHDIKQKKLEEETKHIIEEINEELKHYD